MNLDSAYKWLVIAGTALAIMAAPVTATWIIANRIADVRDDLGAEITAVENKVDGVEAKMAEIEVRMAEIGSKLDLIIAGLDIRVGPAGQ